MACLKESTFELATGDPIYCSSCKAILNMYSELKDDESNPGKQIWTCEFCNHKSTVEVEPEEKPRGETVSYILEAAPVKGQQ